MPLIFPKVGLNEYVPSPYVEIKAMIYRGAEPVATSNYHRIDITQLIAMKWTPEAEAMYTNELTYVHNGTNCVAIPAAEPGFNMQATKQQILANIQSRYDQANANILFVLDEDNDESIWSKSTVKQLLVTHEYGSSTNLLGWANYGGCGHTNVTIKSWVYLPAIRNWFAEECQMRMETLANTNKTSYTCDDQEVLVFYVGVHEAGHNLGLVSPKYLGGGTTVIDPVTNDIDDTWWLHNPIENVDYKKYFMTRGNDVELDDRINFIKDINWRPVNKAFLEYRFPKP